jgi:hypothetical protein
MKRRTVLANVGALGAVGLAGCVSGGSDEAAPETSDDVVTETRTETAAEQSTEPTTNTTTPANTTTATDTPMTPTLDDATLEVQRNDCGEQASEASVGFEGDGVVVEGRVWGSDPGWTAVLADASYDREADELSLVVGLTQRETSGPVVQCIAEIEYRTTAAFADGLPGTVTVVHETNEGQETVATVQRE